jgi:SNF2 family DNA or RNA helicase
VVSCPRPALWAHQEAVLADLAMGHWLLLWEMGTGKTAALAVAGGVVGGRQLWLSPAVLLRQSADEIRRWRPGARVQILRTGRDKLDATADVIMLSYDLMRRETVWKQLWKLGFQSCVCDEGHALGHGRSIRTRAFYGATYASAGALYRRCERVWIATGTPVLSSPDELHPHLSRLFPTHVPDFLRRQDFIDHYCITVKRTFGTIVVGARNTKELADTLKACSSRLRLADVTDLPPLIIDHVPTEISRADRQSIEATMTAAQRHELNVVLTQIEGGEEAGWQRLQAMLLPLASTRRVLGLAKAPAALDLIRAELAGGADRIVLFGIHLDALRLLHDALGASHGARLLTGETLPNARADALAAFQTGACRVLIASLRVAGFGLNLQAARRAIFLESDWTPAALDQAVARLYRAGQTRPVHVSLLSVADSIDQRVAAIVARKRVVINQLLGETV